MRRPIARTPVPCIRRLCVGDLPQASGNVARTADQYARRTAQMLSKSVSDVERLWYGNRLPAGLVRLSSSIWMTEASATTAAFRPADGVEARRIRPWKGEAGSRCNRSHRVEGIF